MEPALDEFETRAYRRGHLVSEGFPVRDVRDVLEDDVIVWVNAPLDRAPDLLGHLEGLVDVDEVVIEDLLFDEKAQREVHQRMFVLRKHLVQLRRVVLPMRRR